MKRVLTAAVILAALAVGAVAQDDWYRDRERRFYGEGWRPHIFMQVKMDLDHIWSARFAAQHERNRLDRTQDELAQIQRDFDRGRWDGDLIDNVIEHLAKSSRDERLSRRDRDVLADDTERLRDFRRRHNHRR